LLLKKYKDLQKTFLKVKLNTFTLYCLYNHWIKLKAENTLNYNLFYQHSLEKLLAAKKYIKKNFYKGFIKFS